jgi:hypothetical protein
MAERRDDPAHQGQELPSSFIQLFVPAGRIKPVESWSVIAARYELCEDLAQALTDTAQQQRMALGVEPQDVLQRIRQGLAQPASGLSADEAGWVLTRLAELLAWPCCPRPADG